MQGFNFNFNVITEENWLEGRRIELEEGKSLTPENYNPIWSKILLHYQFKSSKETLTPTNISLHKNHSKILKNPAHKEKIISDGN